MLGQRRRRWANIKTALFQRVVFAGLLLNNFVQNSEIVSATVLLHGNYPVCCFGYFPSPAPEFGNRFHLPFLHNGSARDSTEQIRRAAGSSKYAYLRSSMNINVHGHTKIYRKRDFVFFPMVPAVKQWLSANVVKIGVKDRWYVN